MKRKQKVSIKIPAARDPFVALAMKRKAGTHRKSNKAARRSEKVDHQGMQSEGRAFGFYPIGKGSIPFIPTRALPKA